MQGEWYIPTLNCKIIGNIKYRIIGAGLIIAINYLHILSKLHKTKPYLVLIT